MIFIDIYQVIVRDILSDVDIGGWIRITSMASLESIAAVVVNVISEYPDS